MDPDFSQYGCLAQQVERLVEAQEVTDATPVAAATKRCKIELRQTKIWFSDKIGYTQI